MRDRHEGHPLGALLIIAAIFLVALAFSLATPTGPTIPARYDAVLTPHPAAVAATAPDVTMIAPARVSRQPALPIANREAPAASPEPIAPNVAPTAEAAPATAAIEPLAAFSWSTVPSRYPLPAARVGIETPATIEDRGAVTHAFATAGSAIKSALTRVF